MYACVYAHVHAGTWTHVLMRKNQRLTMSIHRCIALHLFVFLAKSSSLSSDLTNWPECWPQSSGGSPCLCSSTRVTDRCLLYHIMPSLYGTGDPSLALHVCVAGTSSLSRPVAPTLFLFSLFCRFAFAVIASSLWTVFPSRKVWAVPSFHRKIFNSGDLKGNILTFPLTSYSGQIFSMYFHL